MRTRALTAVLLLGAALAFTGSVHAQTGDIERVAPVGFGDRFPAGTFRNLNPQIGGAQIDLASTIGSKPIVLYYWIPGNPRADRIFSDLQDVVREAGHNKVALFGVVLLRDGRGEEFVQQGLAKVGVEVPVLDDEGFVLGQQLRVQTVPNITILDAEGKLRLTNGAALAQDLEYKMTVKTAIQRVARTGSVGTYGYLTRYYPVHELVGKDCPAFTAPLITTKAELGSADLLKSDKVNVLIFWSVDCPHCRQSLPEINAWLKKNPDGLNVISAARITNEDSLNRTREFCEVNEFAFPTLVDQDLVIANAFQVTTTPTVVIIGPDGVVDSVVLTGTSVPKTLENKRRELLTDKQG